MPDMPCDLCSMPPLCQGDVPLFLSGLDNDDEDSKPASRQGTPGSKSKKSRSKAQALDSSSSEAESSSDGEEVQPEEKRSKPAPKPKPKPVRPKPDNKRAAKPAPVPVSSESGSDSDSGTDDSSDDDASSSGESQEDQDSVDSGDESGNSSRRDVQVGRAAGAKQPSKPACVTGTKRPPPSSRSNSQQPAPRVPASARRSSWSGAGGDRGADSKEVAAPKERAINPASLPPKKKLKVAAEQEAAAAAAARAAPAPAPSASNQRPASEGPQASACAAAPAPQVKELDLTSVDEDVLKLPAEIRRLAGIKLAKKPAAVVDTSSQAQAASSTRHKPAPLTAPKQEQAADSPRRGDKGGAEQGSGGARDGVSQQSESPNKRGTRMGGAARPAPSKLADKGKGGDRGDEKGGGAKVKEEEKKERKEKRDRDDRRDKKGSTDKEGKDKEGKDKRKPMAAPGAGLQRAQSNSRAGEGSGQPPVSAAKDVVKTPASAPNSKAATPVSTPAANGKAAAAAGSGAQTGKSAKSASAPASGSKAEAQPPSQALNGRAAGAAPAGSKQAAPASNAAAATNSKSAAPAKGNKAAAAASNPASNSKAAAPASTPAPSSKAAKAMSAPEPLGKGSLQTPTPTPSSKATAPDAPASVPAPVTAAGAPGSGVQQAPSGSEQGADKERQRRVDREAQLQRKRERERERRLVIKMRKEWERMYGQPDPSWSEDEFEYKAEKPVPVLPVTEPPPTVIEFPLSAAPATEPPAAPEASQTCAAPEAAAAAATADISETSPPPVPGQAGPQVTGGNTLLDSEVQMCEPVPEGKVDSGSIGQLEGDQAAADGTPDCRPAGKEGRRDSEVAEGRSRDRAAVVAVVAGGPAVATAAVAMAVGVSPKTSPPVVTMVAPSVAPPAVLPLKAPGDVSDDGGAGGEAGRKPPKPTPPGTLRMKSRDSNNKALGKALLPRNSSKDRGGAPAKDSLLARAVPAVSTVGVRKVPVPPVLTAVPTVNHTRVAAIPPVLAAAVRPAQASRRGSDGVPAASEGAHSASASAEEGTRSGGDAPGGGEYEMLDAEAAEALQFMHLRMAGDSGMGGASNSGAAPVVSVPEVTVPPNLSLKAGDTLEIAMAAAAMPTAQAAFVVPRAPRSECSGFKWPQQDLLLPSGVEIFQLPKAWLLARPPKFETLRRNLWVSMPKPKRLPADEVSHCTCRPTYIVAGGFWALLFLGGCMGRTEASAFMPPIMVFAGTRTAHMLNTQLGGPIPATGLLASCLSTAPPHTLCTLSCVRPCMHRGRQPPAAAAQPVGLRARLPEPGVNGVLRPQVVPLRVGLLQPALPPAAAAQDGDVPHREQVREGLGGRSCRILLRRAEQHHAHMAVVEGVWAAGCPACVRMPRQPWWAHRMAHGDSSGQLAGLCVSLTSWSAWPACEKRGVDRGHQAPTPSPNAAD